MKNSIFILLLSSLFVSQSIAGEEIDVQIPSIVLKGIETEVSISISDELLDSLTPEQVSVSINSLQQDISIDHNVISLNFTFSNDAEYIFSINSKVHVVHVKPIPLWMSIIPPLLAILIALIFKEVFTALLLGILVGASIISFYQANPFFLALLKGMLAVIDTYILHALNNPSHLSIIVFSMLIGAMVSLISANGGMHGVVRFLSRYANSPRSGQFITWLLGIAIFFDDYANTLVVGNTMRPVTDRLKISREKLSYIVDSTAAPIAAIAFVTTWIGAEISYIEDGLKTIGLDESAYHVFLNSLAYSFYPVLALIFILLLIWQKRDYGSMFIAEIKARNNEPDINSGDKDISASGSILNIESEKARAVNAVIPVLTIILVTIGGLVYTGLQSNSWNSELGFSANLSIIIGSADSYKALLWSSISGVTIALLLTLSQRLLSLQKSIDSLVNGFKTMITAILILILAWSLAKVTEDLHTADFITNFLVSIELKPYLLPALTFIVAALVAFSTGSSWSTMAILYPLILPATWLLAKEFQLDYELSMKIFYNVVSTVLAGSVLGDHCSPISDTTILSSLASSCRHIDHVKTQLPYALTVGSVSLLFGTTLASFQIPTWILFVLSIAILFFIIRFFGKKVPDQ